MRTLFSVMAIVLLIAQPARAIGDLTAFLNIQQECAQIGNVSFGKNQRWQDCQVTRGRWVSTIELIDMYQAQYCLGNGHGDCAQRALLLIGNRAYTPIATLLFERIDPPGTEYDDPLVIKNDYGYILTLSARLPDGTRSSSYFRWQAGQWAAIDATAWFKDFAKRLPAGITARQGGLPDIDTMSAKVGLYREGDLDCCASAGVAIVDLGLVKQRLSVKGLRIGN